MKLDNNTKTIKKAIVIDDEDVCLFGIFNGFEKHKKIVVFLSAITGTRIGPQRMFKEITNHLLTVGISSICIDMPFSGDSYDRINIMHKDVRTYYNHYLFKIHKFLKSKYPESEIVYCSISVGCMPVLEFSEKVNLRKVILLSPNHLPENRPRINQRNIESYIYKIFKINTWCKLVYFKINWGKIHSNIFNKNEKKQILNKNELNDGVYNKVNLFCIFGSHDAELKNNLQFWEQNNKQKRFITYKQSIIADSDHSFMNWNSKQKLICEISSWLTHE